MRIRIVGSQGSPHQFLITYLINDDVAIDAGFLGCLDMPVQRGVQHVFLSHSHMDHVAALPVFIDNVYIHGPGCPVVHANEATIDSLRRDLFNDRVWPDVVRLSAEESPFVDLRPLPEGNPVEVGELSVTAWPLDHVVPTVAFVVADSSGACVAFVSDTGPTERVWEALNHLPRLDAVFLDASFPNAYAWLAEKSMHLCPEMFAAEAGKLQRPATLVAIHLKPAFRDQIIEELEQLGLPGLRIGEAGDVFEF